ncbi:MAG: ATP phosphoribosyltransferase [Desulfurococcales archaeon]|nr:ATP phosphoribosyltransferase [Desulfurococcales archaeon]
MAKIAVPSKGRLREPTLSLLSRAGIDPIYGDTGDRSLIVPTLMDDVRLAFLRPEDIPSLVYLGASDLGITGLDYVAESGVDVDVCLRLGYGNASIVLAAPEESGIERAEDLGEGARIATKYVNIARRFFESRGVSPLIFRVNGSAEVLPKLGAADAIVDTVSTGVTLRMHGLRPVEGILKTEAVLIARNCTGNREVEAIVETLRGVVNARSIKMVMMNVPGEKLVDVLRILPSMGGPAVTKLESREPMWEVITAVPVAELHRVVYEAKRRGARDIVVLGAERVVP